MPEPIVSPEAGADPEHEALVADSVGLALQIVLDTLTPSERLAFVLHDMFAVPFDEIARIVDRSPDAARQLASRARRRVRGARAEPDVDLQRQRELVDAFHAAHREGNFEQLLAVLDPEVVLRVDNGPLLAPKEIHGAEAVAREASRFADMVPFARPVLVNGAAGSLVVREGRPLALGAFTVRGDRIVEIDIIADPERLAALGLPF
jgi:RNA polymerase sigma-70 factor (ECF subfamily)